MLDIRLGPPQRHEALTVVPLLAAGDPAPQLPYVLLADALAAGDLRIGEIGGGSVPRLIAKNAGEADVLILDGEQLLGAKQNRMTNRSILLPGFSETEIPVSCMEQGRWHWTSGEFASSPQHSPAKVRRKARELEAMRVAEGGVAHWAHLASAQGDVWDTIASISETLGRPSRTGALDAAYDAARADLDAALRAFPVCPGQVGLLGLLEDRPVGLDVIGGVALYARLHERLLRGYLMDALDAGRRGPAPGRPDPEDAPDRAEPDPAGFEARVSLAAQRFLDTVREAPRTAAPSVGRGRYAVLTGDVVGGVLDDDGFDPARLAHLSAFPAAGGDTEGWRATGAEWYGPIARPSRRRRH